MKAEDKAKIMETLGMLTKSITKLQEEIKGISGSSNPLRASKSKAQVVFSMHCTDTQTLNQQADNYTASLINFQSEFLFLWTCRKCVFICLEVKCNLIFCHSAYPVAFDLLLLICNANFPDVSLFYGQAQKELLDAELDLYKKTQSGEDTATLKIKYTQLQIEVITWSWLWKLILKLIIKC